jgi:hypothetical protein
MSKRCEYQMHIRECLIVAYIRIIDPAWCEIQVLRTVSMKTASGIWSPLDAAVRNSNVGRLLKIAMYRKVFILIL